MTEPMTQEEAKAWYDEFKATKHDSTAVLMTPGAYSYEEGIRFKTKEEIRQAVKNSPRIVPLYCSHDEKKLMGAAYNIRVGDDGKAIADIYHEHGLPAGSGVSPGFTTREVSCDEGICQADMKIFHVAADPALEPRHESNRVIKGDSTMADKETEQLKTELDAKNAEIEAIKKEKDKIAKDAADLHSKLADIEKKEHDSLVENIKSRLKKDADVKLDSVSCDGLKTIISVMDSYDSTKESKPFFNGNEGKQPYVHKGNVW